MPMTTDTLRCDSLVVGSTISPARPRTEQSQYTSQIVGVPLDDWFISDTGAHLPTAAAGTQLAHIPGTYGTGCPTLQAGDLKAAGATTRRARRQIPLPIEYVAAGAVSIQLSAGMTTHVADVSCTVQVEAYKVDKTTGLITGSQLVTTSATTINSLTFATIAFALTATTLNPGDWLDVRVSVACNDAASVTAVIPTIAAVDLLCTTQG
jgi:hypothetical protein